MDKTYFCNKTSDDIRSKFIVSCVVENNFFSEGSNDTLIASTNTPCGLMNSSWPMQSHDVYHTGLSPYSTDDNQGVERWRYHSNGEIEQSSAIIDKNGTIYFGALGDYTFYALNYNGTLKWKYQTGGLIWSSPALGDDGIIYFTSWDSKLYAMYSNGTVKWRFGTGYPVKSSPVIAEDGTIYFGGDNKIIYAINSNGTEKWHYPTGDFINSGPAIADDGTIFIGSSDSYLYALYPNGTLRWRFKTGDWIKGNPTIAEDGTVYAPSFDGFLYALNPNGTMKWKATTGNSVAGAGVALTSDGTIYVGTELLRAFYPNGTLKWCSNVGGDIYGSVPAISADGTIYVSAGLNLVAVNPNGEVKWITPIADIHAFSSPCIGEDGTVYVGSTCGGTWFGYLYAIGAGEPRTIEIQSPEPEKLYLFGKELGPTPKNNTIVLGSVKVTAQAHPEHEIQSVHFYLDGKDCYNVTAPPYEWHMNRRYGLLFPFKHTITVTAYYTGGWWRADSIDVYYLHLLPF